MIEKLHLFCTDKYIGDIVHDSEKNSYDFIKKLESPETDMWVYKTNADRGGTWFKDTLLSDRVMSPDRIDCREILRRLGLMEYNPWVIMRNTHFISEDFFWTHKNMVPEWFWTNHPMASYHPRYTEVTGKPMYSTVVEVDQTTIY